MSDRIYRRITSAGAAGIVTGVLVLISGITLGVIMIVHGGKLLATRKHID